MHGKWFVAWLNLHSCCFGVCCPLLSPQSLQKVREGWSLPPLRFWECWHQKYPAVFLAKDGSVSLLWAAFSSGGSCSGSQRKRILERSRAFPKGKDYGSDLVWIQKWVNCTISKAKKEFVWDLSEKNKKLSKYFRGKDHRCMWKTVFLDEFDFCLHQFYNPFLSRNFYMKKVFIPCSILAEVKLKCLFGKCLNVKAFDVWQLRENWGSGMVSRGSCDPNGNLTWGLGSKYNPWRVS